jgi:hypothetical protein
LSLLLLPLPHSAVWLLQLQRLLMPQAWGCFPAETSWQAMGD